MLIAVYPEKQNFCANVHVDFIVFMARTVLDFVSEDQDNNVVSHGYGPNCLFKRDSNILVPF